MLVLLALAALAADPWTELLGPPVIEARRGCSTWTELRAALSDGGFAWTGPVARPGGAEAWWARRGAVTIEVTLDREGAWSARRFGPLPSRRRPKARS